MQRVLCSGNLVLDILVRPADAIEFGTTTWVESMEQHLGGNGASTSYTLGKLGVPVRLLGMVGADGFGDYLLGRLAEAGVDTGGVQRSAAATTTTVGLVKTNGDRALLLRPGASAETYFAPEIWAAAFADADHYHMASPFGLTRLRPHLAGILEQAKAAGLTTSIDTHWDTSGRWLDDLAACLPYTDILFTNEDEARALTGSGMPRESARLLLAKGAQTVVVKLSGKGCIVFRREEEICCPAFAVPAVDTTGAGDCFVGGFLAARGRGWGWLESARFANAVAGLAVQQLGAVEGVRTFAETEQWLRLAQTA